MSHRQFRGSPQCFKILKVLSVLIPVLFSSLAADPLTHWTEILKIESPKLQAQTLEVDSRESEDIGITGFLPNPQFSYSWYGESVETKVGPQEQSFSLSQRIPWPGNLSAKSNLQKVKINQAKLKVQQSEADLIYQLRLKWAYLEHCYFEKFIQDSLYQILTTIESQVKTKFEVGSSSYSKYIKIRNEVELQKDVLTYVDNEIKITKNTINYLVGRDVTSHFEDVPHHHSRLMEYASAYGSQELDVEQTQFLSVQNAKLNMDMSEQVKREATSSYFPEFSLGVSYVQTGEVDAKIAENGKDPWWLTVGVSLPIYFHQTSAKVKAADFQQQRAARIMTEASLQKQEQIKNAFLKIENIHEKRKLCEGTLIPNLEKSIQAQQSAYQSQTIDLLELMETQKLKLKMTLMNHHFYIQEFETKAKILWALGDTQAEFKFPFQSKLKNQLSNTASRLEVRN